MRLRLSISPNLDSMHNDAWRRLESRDLVLSGRFVRLEPLQSQHAVDLGPNLVVSDFNYFLNLAPTAPTREAAEQFIVEATCLPMSCVLAIVQRETGQAIGFSSFLDVRPSYRAVEIGLTWIAPNFRHTEVNPEAKKLMLEFAFEQLGCVRVCLKTDERNVLSQRAIEKLGAHKDGVLRNFGIAIDGHIRNTVMYSVLPEEWPLVKAGLNARLAVS